MKILISTDTSSILNYGILEYIYSELGVKVIWFEDFDELPKLVAKVFNLNTYSEINNVDLIDLIEKKLIDLKSNEINTIIKDTIKLLYPSNDIEEEQKLLLK